MEDIETTLDDIENKLPDSAIPNISLGSVIFAVLAAVTGMLSSYHTSEAVISQVQASDQWGYYQAKGIKSNLLANKIDLYTVLGKLANQADLDKMTQYKKEQDQISEAAREKERSSTLHMKNYLSMARGVNLFQVALVVSVIAIITRRRKLWHMSLLAAAGGLFFLIQGFALNG